MTGALKSYLAEFIGTFALVLSAAGALCVGLDPAACALAYGLAAMSMTYAFGPISGGHFNPALTLGLYAAKRMDTVRCVFYVGSQLLGAAMAGLLLAAAFHHQPSTLGGVFLGKIGFKAATLLEAVATFFLVSAYYAAVFDTRGRAGAAPLAHGAALAAGALWLGPLTGGAMNPARAFGPSLNTGIWAGWYVWWAGPIVGAVAAALLYESLFLERKS
jgi:MIP family channel proteins